MEKENREHQIKIRMTDAELYRFKKRLVMSGQSQQSYIVNAIEGIKSTTPEEIIELRVANESLKSISQNIRAIGNNMNQIAKHANQCAGINYSDVKVLQEYIQALHREASKLWQYSRLVMVRLQGTRL